MGSKIAEKLQTKVFEYLEANTMLAILFIVVVLFLSHLGINDEIIKKKIKEVKK